MLLKYLQSVASMFPTQKTMEGVVLKHGREFSPPSKCRPKGIKKGRDKLCFMNAYRLADRQDGFRYVEGFAVSSDIPFPLHHAWVIDANDNVIETTWTSAGQAYYGILFDMDFINHVILETKTYGVLIAEARYFVISTYNQIP